MIQLTEKVPSLREGTDRGTGQPRNDEERLVAHFGEEKARRLLELVGLALAVRLLPERGTRIETAKLGDVELAVENLSYLTSKLMKFGLDADISMFHMGWDEKVEKTVSDFHDVSFLLELEKTAIEEDWNDCMRNGAMKAYTRLKRGKM